MGRRSNFARIDKDLYRTIDPRAVPPVLPFLLYERIGSFIEPCYGYGDLVGPLTRAGLVCRGRYDIATNSTRTVDPVVIRDGRELRFDDLNEADAIITNPPWSRDLLHELIDRWAKMAPTWLLFDAGWKHSGRARLLLDRYCTDYVPTPRLKWIPGSTFTATDDCGWYRFDAAKDPRHGVRFWPAGATPDNDNFRFSQPEAIGA